MAMALGTMMNLTDEELINSLEDKRHQSPIISELIRRLESHVQSTDVSKVNDRVECPVCMADLQADVDWGNNMFTLKVVDH
jgi:hypothetical protein